MKMKHAFFAVLALLLTTIELNGQNQFVNAIEVNVCANWLRVDWDEVNTPDTSITQWLFIYQHRGATIQTNDNAAFGSLQNLNRAGRYEINQIAALRGDTIFPIFQLQHNYLVSNSFTQIVIQADLSETTITNAQNAAVFDGQKGGIIFLAATDTLQLDASLSAAGAGFAGGAAVIQESECGTFTNANDYFYQASNWRGAFKGGSPSNPNLLTGRETGRGPNLSGGGGGNDHNSGGGGGGHFGVGGNGAPNMEPGFFNCKGNFPGLGGLALPTISDDVELIFMGSGGGAGHGNNPNPTAGGNGGGLIVLYAQHISFGTNTQLLANGLSADLVDGDGGGGGGSGGTVLLLAETSTGTPNTISLSGGNGGDTDNNNQNRCFGPGGGGAGGRLLVANGIGGLMNEDLLGGTGGESLNSQACNPGENVANSGDPGEVRRDYSFEPSTIQDALGYPLASVFLPEVCPGDAVEIGFPTDESCFASQWFLQTDTGLLSLDDNTFYAGVNTPALSLLNINFTDTTTFRLERYDATGRIVASTEITLLPGLLPTSSFSATSDEFTLMLTNLSTDATSFSWDFGDSNGSTMPSPSHTYAANGTYTVTLIANNGCGADTSQQIITIAGTLVMPLIESTLTLGCAPFAVTFFNVSTGPVTGIEWNFTGANITTSSSDTVTVLFQDPGNFTATLTVNGTGGPLTTTQNIEVIPAPIPMFEVSENGGTISLTNLSQNATSYLWDFGDSNTSTDFEPTHQYQNPGDYEITLNAQTIACSQATSTSITVDEITSTLDEIASQLQVYPNPSTGLFQISGPRCVYQIFDSKGRQVLANGNKPPGTWDIDLRHVPTGIYWLRIQLTEGTILRKLVIQ